jgi:hypothetical protein
MHLHALPVSEWVESVLPAAICAPFDLHVGVDTAITPDSLRRLVGAGKVEVPGAEELDIPSRLTSTEGRPGNLNPMELN